MFTRYFEHGYAPIPIARNGKNPTILQWQKYCTEKPSESLIDLWESDYQNGLSNIGITCGPASGIIVLDIDTDNQEILNLCPSSPVVRRGKKGEARFFKYSEKVKSTSIAGILDVLSTGRQILVPPSIHPDTKKPYVWLTVDTLESVKASELPDLDLSFLSKIDVSAKIVSNGATEGRNNKLKNMSVKMLSYGKEVSEIAREIYEYDKINHTPRLMTDATERGFGAKNEDEAYANAYGFVSRIAASLTKDRPDLFKKTEIIVDVDSLASNGASNKSKSFTPMPYPRPRGVMGKFFEYCDIKGECNQDAVGLGASIAFMAILCSNRFVAKSARYTTSPVSYVLNLLPSGLGKDVAKDLLTKLLEPTGLIGAANYSSGPAIVRFLPQKQERLDVMDEMQSLLNAMSSDEGYKRDIVDALCFLYTSSMSKYIGYTSVADGQNLGACWNPCVSIIGFTNPAGFKESVTRAMAEKGLMPRFFLFTQYEYGSFRGYNDVSRAESVYQELKSFVDSILAIDKRPVPIESNLLTTVKDKEGKDVSCGVAYDPIKVPFSKEANDAMLRFAHKCYDAKIEKLSSANNSFESAFVARFAEKATKLALFDAIGLARNTIEVDSVEWAISVVEAEWHNALPFYEIATAGTRFEALYIEMLKFIRDRGLVSKTDFGAKFRSPKPKEREEILREMVDQNLIEIVKVSGSGKKPETFYRAL